MPLLDGYITTSILRGYGTSTPIIGVTAHALVGEKEKCLNAGMNDYISKPIDADLLYEKITQLVRRQVFDKRKIAVEHSNINDNENYIPELIDGIHVKKAVTRLDNNLDLYISVIRDFTKRGQYEFGNLKEAYQKEDVTLLRHIAHTVKGVAGTIGAESLKKSAESIEVAIKNNNLSEETYLLDNYESLLNDTIAILNSHPFFQKNYNDESMDNNSSVLLNRLLWSIDEDQSISSDILINLKVQLPVYSEEIENMISLAENYDFDKLRIIAGVLRDRINMKVIAGDPHA
jgi:HPt (histidine-containing phosphotransfer) domain-containing protein